MPRVKLAHRVSCAVLVAAAAISQAAEPAGFDVRTLPVPGRITEAVVFPASDPLPAGAACFFVRETDGRKTRHVAFFSGAALEARGEVSVPAGAAVFDLADVLPAPGLELVYLCSDGVVAQPRGGEGFAAAPVRLLEARTFFDRPQPDAIHRLAFCLDLTGDGRAELVVPQHYGYLIAAREGDAFARLAPLSLAGRNRMIRLAHEVFQLDFAAQHCTLPALTAADFDGDGKPDLLALRNKALVGFLNRGAEGFRREPDFDVALPALASVTDETEEDSFEGTRVFLEELNGDGRVDLVAVRTQGKVGLFASIRTRFELFLGREGAFYPKLPDRILTVPGVGILPEFIDLDGDGLKDLACSSIRTDLLAGVRTALVQEVTVSWHLFAAGDRGLWEASPGFSESASLPLARLEEGRAVPAAAFSGDFDGDGRRDRLVFEEGEVRIHPGLANTRFAFAGEPRWRVEAAVSNDLEVADANGDGVSDILFFHKNKVVAVLSRR